MATLNPPTTLTFENKGEAIEHLNFLRFKRLPTRGPIERFALHTYDDDGCPIIIFASSAGKRDNGEVLYHFVETPRNSRDASSVGRAPAF